MKEPYTEGIAHHGDPESCVAICEDGGEALTGARAGRAIEPRNKATGAPRLFTLSKATPAAASCASRSRAPRGRRT
jgi:hypothetical protein